MNIAIAVVFFSYKGYFLGRLMKCLKRSIATKREEEILKWLAAGDFALSMGVYLYWSRV